jgi:hypothetical protein
MKKLLILLLILSSCQEEPIEPTPQPQTQTYCMCGEITNINSYAPFTEFTYTLKNNCTGNITTTTNATYYDYGNDMCLNYEW